MNFLENFEDFQGTSKMKWSLDLFHFTSDRVEKNIGYRCTSLCRFAEIVTKGWSRLYLRQDTSETCPSEMQSRRACLTRENCSNPPWNVSCLLRKV